MIKLFITAVESRPDGTAVTIFEDYLVTRKDVEELRDFDQLAFEIADKIEAVELINEQASSPF